MPFNLSLMKQRKSKEDTVTDTFFWPTMPLNLVMSKLDSRNRKSESSSHAYFNCI